MDLAGRQGTRTARGRRLASELQGLRVRAGLSQRAVVDQLGVATSTMYRIETGKAVPQGRTLRSLLDLYRASDQERSRILELAEGASSRGGWLHPYEELIPETYLELISFEGDADRLSNYESLLVPGLLQTADYARALITGVLSMATPDDIERKVEVRLQRQAVLGGETPVQLEAVIDEAALHRVVGSSAVMRAQLRALCEPRPSVDLRVIPFVAGAHPGMMGSFVIMHFGGEVDDLVYIESLGGDLFREAPADTERFGLLFQQLHALALDPSDSADLIGAAEKRYKGGT